MQRNHYDIQSSVQYLYKAMFGVLRMDRTLFKRDNIKWSFPYNSYVKFNIKKNWEPQHDSFNSKLVL